MDLVHVHASAEELGRVYQAALPINSGMQGFARMARAMKPVDHSAWDAQTGAARAEYEAWQQHSPNAGQVQMGEIIAYLRNKLPKDAIVTNGAGNYATWFHRFYRWRSYRTQLAPTNGSMGYGVPAAVAAKLVHPERIVVSANGDGCFLMNGQEIATAVQHNANVIFLVINNGMYGTIRMHQEREYPGRTVATALKNPDFAAYAAAFGGFGVKVEKTGDFPAAFAAAEKSGKPAIIHLKVDPEAITPMTTLAQIREKSMAARG
jgi:acetolactate synthase-1/2/3 large subunit